MTVTDLAELAGWNAEAALQARAATPEELAKARLGVAFLAALDGISTLATAATDERVRLAACREVVALARMFGAVEADPASGLLRLLGDLHAADDDRR
jgi:hypothetical protein